MMWSQKIINWGNHWKGEIHPDTSELIRPELVLKA